MAYVTDPTDSKLNPTQVAIMEDMIEKGMEEREAKLRALCMAAPPEISVPLPPKRGPHGPHYPRMVYHPDGRMNVCQDPDNFEAAMAAGWEDKPSVIHTLPKGTKLNLSFCPKCDTEDLGGKFCPNCGAALELQEGFSVPATAEIAVKKQRARAARGAQAKAAQAD